MNTPSTTHQRWNERDLIRRLCHALDIASLTIEHLAPAGYKDPENPAANVRPEKPIAETAVLLNGAAIARNHPEVNARIHSVACQLAPHARSAQIKLGLALNPALAFDYSLAHIILTRLGYPDPAFEALLNQCRSSQAYLGRERVPHRMLEQQWIASLRGETIPTQSLSLARLAQLSILAQPMDLFASTDEDLYAFTHAIMYVTGFKRNPADLPRSRATILGEAEAALARCLDSQDYDLAGEILLAWPLTGKIWSPVATFAFHVLAGVEDKAGFLPTPATRVSELKNREGADRKQYLLATAYHTAYVMGLLCAAALQPNCAPTTQIPFRRTVAGSADNMLPLLGKRPDHEQTTPHWQDTFARLDHAQADALSGFLLTIALQRKAAQRDYTGLSQILMLGYNLGLATTPAASQAAEMLERLAIYAHATQPPTPANPEADDQANDDESELLTVPAEQIPDASKTPSQYV